MNIKCIYGIQVQKYDTIESVCLMNNILLSFSLSHSLSLSLSLSFSDLFPSIQSLC